MSRVRSDRAFTLIELVVVIGIMALLVSVLLPVLSHARKAAVERVGSDLIQNVTAPTSKPPRGTQAIIKSFDAHIVLTPKLSVGTDQPESIYSVNFTAHLDALGPRTNPTQCEVRLPLPPEVISLSDLSVTLNGKPSDTLAIESGELVWHGTLSSTAPTPVQVTYLAVGKGIYTLQPPSSCIIEQFKINLTAAGSDVRMLELSMQPTTSSHQAGNTKYTWDYQRLIFGRPVAVDVLGIAPVDRLGELSWLGPISIVLFGLLLGLVTRAYPAANFDRWMLLLVLGTFTGAYPLMFFAQEYIPLKWAIVTSGGLVLLIIAIRAATIMPWRVAIGGIVLPAAAVMTLALIAAVKPSLQGIVLTTMGLGMFILAMVLAPRLHAGPERTDVGPDSAPAPA